MSTMVSTCSMKTGHASMQARQVVQDQRTSSDTASIIEVWGAGGSWPGAAASRAGARSWV